MTVNVVPYVIQALSHPADNFRRALSFVGLGQQGVRSWVGGDLAVSQNGSPNMSVNVAAGQALINGTQNTVSQGSYEMLNDAVVNLAIAASDPTNPRIDIVCASIQDAVYSGAANQALLQVVTGTPAPSPSPPATPANSIVLAQVAVAANATSIVNANITDKRPIFGSLFHAEVYQSASSTIATATLTSPTFDTIEGDPNGNIASLGTTSVKYNVPVPGRFRVSTQCEWSSFPTGQYSTVSIAKNGVELKRLSDLNYTSGSVNRGQGGSASIRCASGDFLQVAVNQQSGANQTLLGGSAITYAEFEYVGPN